MGKHQGQSRHREFREELWARAFVVSLGRNRLGRVSRLRLANLNNSSRFGGREAALVNRYLILW